MNLLCLSSATQNQKKTKFLEPRMTLPCLQIVQCGMTPLLRLLMAFTWILTTTPHSQNKSDFPCLFCEWDMGVNVHFDSLLLPHSARGLQQLFKDWLLRCQKYSLVQVFPIICYHLFSCLSKSPWFTTDFLRIYLSQWTCQEVLFLIVLLPLHISHFVLNSWTAFRRKISVLSNQANQANCRISISSQQLKGK